MTQNQPASPPPLRRIVCAYDLGALPVWWLQVHRWIKTRLEQARARTKVDLAPLTSLPADVDLIVVAPDLLDSARARAPQIECVAIAAEDYPRQIVALLAQLQAEGRLAADAGAASAEEELVPRIVRYIGYERVD